MTRRDQFRRAFSHGHRDRLCGYGLADNPNDNGAGTTTEWFAWRLGWRAAAGQVAKSAQLERVGVTW